VRVAQPGDEADRARAMVTPRPFNCSVRWVAGRLNTTAISPLARRFASTPAPSLPDRNTVSSPEGSTRPAAVIAEGAIFRPAPGRSQGLPL
jgi:hypothetical protein